LFEAVLSLASCPRRPVLSRGTIGWIRLRENDDSYLLGILRPDRLDDAPDDQNSAERSKSFRAVKPSQGELAAETSDDECDSDEDVPHGDSDGLRE
jgi:hypothetical protein